MALTISIFRGNVRLYCGDAFAPGTAKPGVVSENIWTPDLRWSNSISIIRIIHLMSGTR